MDDLPKGFKEDPKFQNETEQREAAIAERIKQLKIVEHEFVTAWDTHGFPKIELAGDIIEAKKKLNREEVEFIIKWIPEISNRLGSKETLVRALIFAASPFDGRVLMNVFDDPDSNFYLKWAIGNTIDSVKVLNVTEWLKSKFESLALGKEKEMLVFALGKYLTAEEARDYLIKIFDNYPSHAADTLAKIGDRNDLKFLREKLATYNGPSRALIAKSAKKLEKRLEKSGDL